MVSQIIRTPELPRFLYHPKRYGHAPGYPRLDVQLDHHTSLEPGCQPLMLQVNVVGDDHSIKHLHLHNKLPLDRELYRICAGRLLVFELDGETLQSFSFGGHLSVVTQPGFTSCVITSAAPIIPLRPLTRSDLGTRLATEAQNLFAQRQAAWSSNQAGFEMRLAQADPHQLYCACLDCLYHEQTSRRADSRDEFDVLFSDYISDEIQILHERGEWPARLFSLAELL